MGTDVLRSQKVKEIKAGSALFGNGKDIVFIAGPCVIENEESALRHAEKISEIAGKTKIQFVFKASYDKANRSSVDSFRGPGLKKGLEILGRVRRKTGLPVLTDVHCKEDVNFVAETVDIIQIPAFLSRQTDLLTTAAKTKKVVNVKKGQFLSPWDMKNVVKKIESAGNERILITERGVSFGYNNLVSDFRAVPVMRATGYPVIYDATHSVQLPGGQGKCSGGDAGFIPVLARCAVAAGCDAVFLEVHEDPGRAKCDGPNSLPLHKLEDLVLELTEISRAVNKS